MLNIGSESRCDICLDSFDNGDKNPHAIRCGHMFCPGCIGALANSPTHVYPAAACPLCRQPFSLVNDVWKLHVDLEPRQGARRADSTTPQPTVQQEEEAQQLRQSFITIATEGADEARTRNVLQAITDFVRPLPRDFFWDLRMVARLLAYTCDVRSKNRTLRATLAEKEKKLTELHSDADMWKKRYEDERNYREEKQKAAEASEKDLKQYILGLSKTYEATVGHYNFVVDEWMKQNEEMNNLRTAFSELRDRSAQPNSRTRMPPSPPAARSSFYVNREDYESRLSGTVITNPDSLLVSPLPEFTSLPTGLFSCLEPDLEEEAEAESVADSWGPIATESATATPRPDCDLLSLPPSNTSAETSERGVNTRRLNDLLSDTPTPSVVSSSLPVTSHITSSFDSRPRERPRSHSTANSHSPTSRSRQEPATTAPPASASSESIESSQPANIRVNAPVYDPTAYSSASAAAQAAEKAKRARHRAERDGERGGRPATPEREATPKVGRERQRSDLSRQDSRRDHTSKTPMPAAYGKYNYNGIHPPMLPPREAPTVTPGYSSVRGAGYSARSQQPKLQDVFSTDRHMAAPVPLGARG